MEMCVLWRALLTSWMENGAWEEAGEAGLELKAVGKRPNGVWKGELP